MTPQELESIKINARIVAIESLLAATLSALTRSQDARQSLLAALDQMVATSSQVRFPDMKPEYSDLMAAEGQEATESLAAFLRNHLQKR